MELTLISILCVFGLLCFMMLGVPIVYSLGFCAVTAGLIAFGSTCLPKVGWTPFHMLFNLAWTPLPLFVLLGSIVSETGIGQDLFKAAMNWLSRIRGGLIVAGILGEAAMAATIGTSAATVVVVGKVAVPEFERYGYNRSLGLGALLAGGVLGPLIPPSATMIIYSVLTDVSLGKLFMAGVMPGLLLAIILSLPVILICWWRPQFAPQTQSVSWGERFASLRKVWPVIVVMVCVLGSIYMGSLGRFTPSHNRSRGNQCHGSFSPYWRFILHLHSGKCQYSQVFTEHRWVLSDIPMDGNYCYKYYSSGFGMYYRSIDHHAADHTYLLSVNCQPGF